MLSRRHALLAAATTFAALALPAVASAEDFCVGGPAGCTGTPVAAGGLKAALTAAQSNGTDDRFFLAPGVYSTDAFSHKSSERVQIVGAGRGKTILRGSLADEATLWLEGNPASSASSLTVEATGGMRAGLVLWGTHARDVAVGINGTGFSGFGAAVAGAGTFEDGTVNLGSNDGDAMLVAYAGTVTGSALHASNGQVAVRAAGGTATVERSTLTGGLGAAADSSRVTITDSVINAGAIGAAADPQGGSTTAAVDLERVTIVGGQIGVFAHADDAGESATARVRDSVMHATGTPVARMASNGASAATVITDRSAYPAPVQPIDIGPGKLAETHHLSVNPRFVDGSAGDFHLAADSPLIDAGTPGSTPAEATDRDGRLRASDGNGDCNQVPDIGAFEYQGTEVRALATASVATAGTGQPVEFSAAGSCIPGPGAPTIRWSFDDGATATGATVGHAFATAGRHTATLTVSDGAGHSAVATATIAVSASAAGAITAQGSGPRISRLRVTPTRVRIGGRLPKLLRRSVRSPSATIGFLLSKRATVTLRFAKLRPNGTPRMLSTKVRVKARKGRNRIRFAARLSRRVALKPGAYRLTMVATDVAGNRSKPAKTRFAAVKPAGR